MLFRSANALGMSALTLSSMGVAFDKTVEYLKDRTSNFSTHSLPGLHPKQAGQDERQDGNCLFLFDYRSPPLGREANHRDTMLIVPLAKQFICDTSIETCAEAVQMRGCVGVNPDSGIVKYLGDAVGYGIAGDPSDMNLVTATKYMGLPGANFECL